ncbi:reverse transcriptase domain-containing protein [Tanacetum coccineum]|uniref:Reverse transcriptase domain-containing protein n=1 Tax=Tanacetum coccineum TaxID=301880 RepID=A0ABQ5DJL8_9ASTR
MADQRTMAELLRAPTEGYAEAIVVPPIPAEHFELKHSLINLVTSKQFFGFEKEDPHAHIRYFNKITSTLKYKDVPETSIKLMLFPFSIDGPARIWLDKEPSRSILTWDDLCIQTRSSSKFVGEPSTNPTSMILKRHNRRRSKQSRTAEAIVVPPIPAEHFELKHSLINLVTSKQFFGFEKEDPHAHIQYFNKITSTLKYKDVPETSIKLMLFPFSIDGPAHIWLEKEPSRSILTWDDLVSKFINHFFPLTKTTNLWNEISNFQQRLTKHFMRHGTDSRICFSSRSELQLGKYRLSSPECNQNYQAPPQVGPSNDLSSYMKTNDVNMKIMQNQITNMRTELKKEMDNTLTRQNNAFKNELTNDIKNMMSSFFQMNTASSSGSGSLPSNTVANLRGDLKAITTRSGISYDGP